MKRRIFFWLETLKITPAERRTVSVLMVILAVFAGANVMYSPAVPFEDEDYHELEQAFRKRTEALEAREQELLKRYYPPDMDVRETVSADTLPVDTLAEDSSVSGTNIGEKRRININTADPATLETLPGIGPAYARRIVEYRNMNGAFKSLEELKNIRGIAEKRLDKLKPFIKLKDP